MHRNKYRNVRKFFLRMRSDKMQRWWVVAFFHLGGWSFLMPHSPQRHTLRHQALLRDGDIASFCEMGSVRVPDFVNSEDEAVKTLDDVRLAIEAATGEEIHEKGRARSGDEFRKILEKASFGDLALVMNLNDASLMISRSDNIRRQWDEKIVASILSVRPPETEEEKTLRFDRILKAGERFERMGFDAAAVGTFGRLVSVAAPELDPVRQAYAYFRQGHAMYDGLGDTFGAEDKFDTATTLDPQSAQAWAGLGVCRRDGDDITALYTALGKTPAAKGRAKKEWRKHLTKKKIVEDRPYKVEVIRADPEMKLTVLMANGIPPEMRIPKFFVGDNATIFTAYLKAAVNDVGVMKKVNITLEVVDGMSDQVRESLERLWKSGKLIVHDREAFRGAVVRNHGVTEGQDQVLQGFERAQALWDGLTLSDDVAAARELFWDTLPKEENVTTELQHALDIFKERYPYYTDKCDNCGAQGTILVGDVTSTLEEQKRDRAKRAELRYCPECGKLTRFLRSNAVRTILTNGRGRCGEYSAAFAAALLARGLPTRWVYDSTDHVWNEVFLDEKWIHVDPCEAALDEPLLYSSNWGKNGSLVLGFDDDQGVTDLTEKYYPDTAMVSASRSELQLNSTTLTKLLDDYRKTGVTESNFTSHLRALCRAAVWRYAESQSRDLLDDEAASIPAYLKDALRWGVLYNVTDLIGRGGTFSVLQKAVQAANLNDDSLVVELGVFRGRSLRMLQRLSPAKTTFHAFDSFQGLPEDWDAGDPRGAYTTHGKVPDIANVEFHVGWFNETLPSFVDGLSKDIALAHLDCDLYSSTSEALDLLAPHLKSGAVLVFDDFLGGHSNWLLGQAKAFHDAVDKFQWSFNVVAASLPTKQVVIQLT